MTLAARPSSFVPEPGPDAALRSVGRRRGELELSGPGYVGQRRRERVDVGELLDALARFPDPARALEPATLQAILPAGQRAGERISGRSIRAQLPRGDVVITFFTGRSGWRSLWPGPSDARHVHRRAHQLRLAAVQTPRSLGFVERARGAGRGPSWHVTEHVGAPSLAVLRDSGVLGDPGERRRCGLAAARAASRLHRGGFVLGQPSADAMIMQDDEVVWANLGRIRRSRRRRAQARDLAWLALEFEGAVGPVERGRFLAAYLGRVPEPRAARAAWVAAVEREASRARTDPV